MATVDAKSFLALEKSLSSRLVSAWAEISSPLVEEITDYIRKGDYASAIMVAEGIDLAPLVEQEKNYLRYITTASLLFGASRVTPDVKQASLSSVKMDSVVDSAVALLSRSIEYNVEDYIRSKLLAYISKASLDDEHTNYSPSDFVFKYSPDQPRHPAGTSEGGQFAKVNVSWRDPKPEWTQEMRDMWEQVKDLPSDSPDPTNQKFRSMVDDVRNREREWSKQMAVAVSMGEIPMKEAYAKGYFPGSHHADDVKPLPQVLFHVTTAYDKVVEGGLKSRDELNQQSGAGLGGGPSNTISFTTDKATAEGIHAGILFARDFAAGTVTPNDLVEWSRTGHEGSRSFFKHLNDPYGKATREDLFPGTDLTIPLYDTLHGTNTREFLKTMVKDGVVNAFGMSGRDWEGAKVTVIEDRGDTVLVQAKATSQQVQDRNESLFKRFMTHRESAGGPLDPLFFSSDLEGLAKIPKDQIRLLQFKPKPNTFGHATSGLSEWRVYTGATVELTEVIKAALVRKFNPYHEPAGSPKGGQFTWKRNVGFSYDKEKKTWLDVDGNPVSQEDHDRMKALAVPPAWTNVRLNPDPHGELQVVGIDSKGNEQPKYSPEHNQKSHAQIHARIRDLHKMMDRVKAKVSRDMDNESLSTQERDTAAVTHLLIKAAVRIGGEKGNTRHIPFGASTLQGQHMKIEGDKITLNFTGKSGVRINKTFEDAKLAGYLRGRKLVKGEAIFSTTKDRVNRYIKEITGDSYFSAKDFRTWNATGKALSVIKRLPIPKDAKSFKKLLSKVAKAVSKHLGNTPNVAIKYYIDPTVFKRWSVDRSWLLKGHAALASIAKVEQDDEDFYSILEDYFAYDPYSNYSDWRHTPTTFVDPDEESEGEETVDVKKFNPNHEPAGSPKGGQFAKATSGAGVPKHMWQEKNTASDLRRYRPSEKMWIKEAEAKQRAYEKSSEGRVGVKYDAVLEGEKVSEEMHRKFLGFGKLKEFVSREGSSMEAPDSPPQIKLGKMKSCFENASKVIMFNQFTEDDEKYKYCEGYVMLPTLPIPIHHAWLQDKDGKVVDPTLGWQPKASYIGIAYSKDDLFRSLRKNKTYGLFIGPDEMPTEFVKIAKDEDTLLFLHSSPTGVPVPEEVLKSLAYVAKAEIVRPFVSFANDISRDGYNMMQLISSLHTSRLSAYGFTVEANLTGVEKYAVSEQLDNRVCPICEIMHGKTFDVSDAQDLLQGALTTDNPDDLRTIQPWPKQDKDSVAAFRKLSSDDLVSRGWHLPPYHPYCRGILVKVDEVPRIEDTPSFQAAFGRPLAGVLATDALATTYGLQAAELLAIRELVAGKSGEEAIAAWNELKKTYEVSLLEDLLGVVEREVLAGNVYF